MTSSDTRTIEFDLYLITDRHQVKGCDLLQAVDAALSAGVKGVQLREKDMSSLSLYELAVEMKKLTDRYDADLIINDRVDIALAVDASGVHLGGESIPIDQARRILGDSKLIGASCHSQESAIAAQASGADFITFGPVFSTPSKALYGPPVGLEELEAVTSLIKIPVFGLGGINHQNINQALDKGVHGVSVISAIIASEAPRDAALDMLAEISAFRKNHNRQ